MHTRTSKAAPGVRGPSPSSRLLSCSFEGSAQGAGGGKPEGTWFRCCRLEMFYRPPSSQSPPKARTALRTASRAPFCFSTDAEAWICQHSVGRPYARARQDGSVVNLRRRGGVGRSAASQSIKGGCNKSNLQAFAEENILGVLGGVAPALWS